MFALEQSNIIAFIMSIRASQEKGRQVAKILIKC